MTIDPASRSTAVRGTHIDGEIMAMAARGGNRPGVAVATDGGRCWWLDVSLNVTATIDTGVDLPIAIAIHPEKDQIAVGGTQGHAIWNVTGQRLHEGSGWSSATAYDPRGRLAVASGRHLVLIDNEPASARVSAEAPSTITGLTWLPDGNGVAASSYGGVHVFDADGGSLVRLFPYAGSHLTVAVDPTGAWVCSGNQDASVHIWRVSDGDELEMSGFPDKVARVSFDGSGQWLATSGAPELLVWDFSGRGPRGRKPRLLAGHTRVAEVAWQPGPGRGLASVGSEGSLRLWDLTGMAAGRTREAHRVLPFGDATGVDWIRTDLVAVARRDGQLNLVALR